MCARTNLNREIYYLLSLNVADTQKPFSKSLPANTQRCNNVVDKLYEGCGITTLLQRCHNVVEKCIPVSFFKILYLNGLIFHL
jgi:hypothetical protein